MATPVAPYTGPSNEPQKRNGSVTLAQGPPAVRLEKVSKTFGTVAALRNVSLTVPQGEIFGLLGPNGAGKSTLLKLLLGFLRPDDGGKIELFGSTDLARAHLRTGYLPDHPRYHDNFTGREYLLLHARLSGLHGKAARLSTDRIIEAVGLKDAAGRRIRSYSKGMRQRLGLAVALTSAGGGPPELLMLDEPASGLAPEGQVAVREVIADCRERGSTVLLSSHQLTEVERICTAVGILRAGRLVVQTRLDTSPRVNITGAPRDGAFEIAPDLIAYLRGLHPETVVEWGAIPGSPLYVSVPTGNAVQHAAALKSAAIRAMLDARWDIISLHIESKDLETIYLRAVRPSGDAAGERNGTGTLFAPSSSLTRIQQDARAVPESAGGVVAGKEGYDLDTGSNERSGRPEPLPARPVAGTRSGPPTTPLDQAPEVETSAGKGEEGEWKG